MQPAQTVTAAAMCLIRQAPGPDRRTSCARARSILLKGIDWIALQIHRRRRNRLSEDPGPTATAPLQVSFSKNFGRTLRHALSMAEELEHDAVTPEHLLLALTDDPEAADVMESCGVDLDTLCEVLAASLETPPPAPDRRFYDVIRRAADLIQDTLELEVSGAHVLLALLGDPAAKVLQDHG